MGFQSQSPNTTKFGINEAGSIQRLFTHIQRLPNQQPATETNNSTKSRRCTSTDTRTVIIINCLTLHRRSATFHVAAFNSYSSTSFPCVFRSDPSLSRRFGRRILSVIPIARTIERRLRVTTGKLNAAWSRRRRSCLEHSLATTKLGRRGRKRRARRWSLILVAAIHADSHDFFPRITHRMPMLLMVLMWLGLLRLM